MKTDLQILSAGHSAQNAARRMRDFGVRFLAICDSAGKVVGTITDGDIAVRVVAEGRAAELCAVDEVMSRILVTCRPEDDIEVVKKLIAAHCIRQVLVTDPAGKLKGLVEASSVPLLRPASGVRMARAARSTSEIDSSKAATALNASLQRLGARSTA